MAEPYYCTTDDLRSALGVDSTALPDQAATDLIVEAEDVVDQLLGAWPVNLVTGRKITSVGALSWQFDKLKRATVKIAQAVYADPAVFAQRQYTTQRGPDFTLTGPAGAGGILGTQVLTILNASGLRRMTTRATPRVDQRGLGFLPEQIANGPDLIEDSDMSGAFEGADAGFGEV